MRILLSCLQSLKRHAIAPYLHWRSYLVAGIEEAGHDVVEVPGVDWAEGLTYPSGPELDSWRSRTWDATLAFVRREHANHPIDFFLCYFFPNQIEPAAISQIQDLGIPCVNFFCDNVREFQSIPARFHPFALHWVPEYEALSKYRKAGLPFISAAMPCWVPTEFRSTPANESEPATFIGSADQLRRDLFGRALQHGADLVLRGHDWRPDGRIQPNVTWDRSPRAILRNQISLVREFGFVALLMKLDARLRPLHPPAIPDSRIGLPVSDAEYVRISREARVTLGVNRVPTHTHSLHHPLAYSRLRDIEAPMLGACYLTEWTAGLEQMYEVGKDIEVYRTDAELAEKLGGLLKDADRRKSLRLSGQRQALSAHSIGTTIRRIQERLGL